MTDWDASSYHRVSAPQFDWGQRVIARLAPRPHERILDLGCGTGRLTGEIRQRLRGGRVVGLDRSKSMLTVARTSQHAAGPPAIRYVQGDGAALPFAGAFDAVFSAATLHWIHDHPAVFASVFAALRPGGRMVAQCGGAANLGRLLARAAVLMQAPDFARFFEGWADPWYFADPGATARRLQAAGFVDIETSLAEAPADLGSAEGFAEFIAVVCIRHHLERLPEDRRGPFTCALTDASRGDTPPFVLDYQRLNIAARKPA